MKVIVQEWVDPKVAEDGPKCPFVSFTLSTDVGAAADAAIAMQARGLKRECIFEAEVSDDLYAEVDGAGLYEETDLDKLPPPVGVKNVITPAIYHQQTLDLGPLRAA